jgi:hypothetical protein
MARRRIGQEAFGFKADRAGRRSSLDDLTGLVEWMPIERQLGNIHAAAKGEPA